MEIEMDRFYVGTNVIILYELWKCVARSKDNIPPHIMQTELRLARERTQTLTYTHKTQVPAVTAFDDDLHVFIVTIFVSLSLFLWRNFI